MCEMRAERVQRELRAIVLEAFDSTKQGTDGSKEKSTTSDDLKELANRTYGSRTKSAREPKYGKKMCSIGHGAGRGAQSSANPLQDGRGPGLRHGKGPPARPDRRSVRRQGRASAHRGLQRANPGYGRVVARSSGLKVCRYVENKHTRWLRKHNGRRERLRAQKLPQARTKRAR